MQQRQGKGNLAETVDQLADDIGALVPEEHAGEHLDLEVGAQFDLTQGLVQLFDHVACIPRKVFKIHAKLEVIHQLAQMLLQGVALRVIGAIGGLCGGFVVLDVFGADGGPHKNEVVLEITAVQYLGGDGIEEGLSQLGLVVVDQQADVVQLDLVPHIHGLLARLELALQPG